MSQTLLIIIALVLLVLVATVAYNMHQESQYRRKIREQFGHSDRDALLGSDTQSVRDGKVFGIEKLSIKPLIKAAQEKKEQLLNAAKPDVATSEQPAPRSADNAPERAPEAPIEPAAAPSEKLINIPNPNAPFAPSQAELTFEPVDNGSNKKAKKGKLLISLEDLVQNQLPWFDARFDYMAYVALRRGQELHAIPRLSSRHRFQIIGCTMDARFQVAEPIPGVQYQAFVIGLQAISRSGLSSADELAQFGDSVAAFAEQMNGDYLLTDVDEFLSVATPLDELCARVDQTIAIHLVSRANIVGTELRNALEQKGFQLMHDGSFGLLSDNGDTKFSVVTLNGAAFTQSLLATQSYQGFSMLFDITRVPAGRAHFDEFMDLAVKLSIALNLDLVDDQLQELSNEWLVDIRNYVLARQEEMLAVGIEPSGELAARLFA